MFSMETMKRGTNERRKLRGAEARVGLTTPLGEVGLLLSATPLVVVGVGVGTVVLPLQVEELGTSGTVSSASFLDILRGGDARRIANSWGPGTGGGMKEDPGEGKGWEGSGGGRRGGGWGEEEDVPLQVDIAVIFSLFVLPQVSVNVVQSFSGVRPSRSCQSDQKCITFVSLHIRTLFALVCVYTRHAVFVVSHSDTRRSIDAARFSSDDIVPRRTPSHVGVGDAALFLRTRICTVRAGTLLVPCTSTEA